MNEIEASSPQAAILDEADTEAERFFAAGEAAASEGLSLSPSTLDDEEWQHVEPPPVSPELVSRRARLRRLVAFGLGGGVALIGAAIGASRWTKLPGAGAASSRPVVARTVAARPLVASPVVASPVVANMALAPITPPSSSVEPSASASAPTEALSVAAPEPDAIAARRLVQESRALLQAGHTREGVAVARRAVEADTALAEPYVLLAAGLEDLGDWNEARRTFATCVERTRSAQCRYFAQGAR